MAPELARLFVAARLRHPTVAAGVRPFLRDSVNAVRGADHAVAAASAHTAAKVGNCHTIFGKRARVAQRVAGGRGVTEQGTPAQVMSLTHHGKLNNSLRPRLSSVNPILGQFR